MKRTILYSAFALTAFSLGYTGTSRVQAHAGKAVRVAASEGDPCEVGASRKMSGYLVSTGRSGEFVCVANS
jgi:hypothetical protein